jgi:type VI secretion system secreted protein VgrG
MSASKTRGGSFTAPNRAPAARVIASALANARVAESLIKALGKYSINTIVASNISQTQNFGSLQVGDLVIHVPFGSAPTGLLGIAGSYSALAYSAVTGSTGAGSTLNGNLGIYPATGSSITNFPPSTYSGTENAGNAAAQAAQAVAQAAYTSLQGLANSGTSGGHINSELGGQSLAAGVYVATAGTAGTFTLNGTLTLTGSASDVYVFQMASTLVTGGTSTPTIILGSVLPSNIYWAVGSSATLNTSHSGTFDGSIVAQASISTTLGSTINGSLIALTGAVTYTGTTISNAAGGGAQASFVPVTVAGTLPIAAVVGDLYIDVTPINLDSNNPLAGATTGDNGLEF